MLFRSYATYVVQNLFRSHLPGAFDWYIVAAIPASFLAAALVGEGLFPAEARAMVKTWSNSWFAEEGVRVLYILPRDWADEVLPLTLNPQPRDLVRVMVGRAEIITPELQREIAAQLKLEQVGDGPAKERLADYSKNLGRFTGPALQLANTLLKPDEHKAIATQAAR